LLQRNRHAAPGPGQPSHDHPHPSTGPQVPIPPIHQDDAYTFAVQNFGHGIVKVHDSTLDPGVFVFSKSKQQWMRISQISTTGAKWGYTPLTSRPSARQINWDFRPLATRPSVQIPLLFQPGIVDLPDSISFDSQHNTYHIAFNSLDPDSPEISTTLQVNRPDLDRAFEK
jgi:hypothetical protein